LLNRVAAVISWGKGGNATSTRWQVTMCDTIWHASFRSGVHRLLYRVRFTARVIIVDLHSSSVCALLQDNVTPLHVASKWGRTAVISLLIDNDANIEALTQVSRTLHSLTLL